MRYVSWAALYEGASDGLYLDVLIPRVLREIVAQQSDQVVEIPDAPNLSLGTSGREITAVAAEFCKARNSIDVVFIHADTGGRGVAAGLHHRADAYCEALNLTCAWPPERCLTITPKHETEAWILADGEAITSALGFNGDASEIGLPASAQEAERLPNPKGTLRNAIEEVAGRRRVQRSDLLFPAIAQRQRLAALRGSTSFRYFEEALVRCLRTLRYVN